MRSIAIAAIVTSSLLLSHAGSASAASPTVACELLTQDRVSAALGAMVGAGSPIARPGTCQWIGKGKIATLTITLAKSNQTPVDQFNVGKTSKNAAVTVEARREPASASSSKRERPPSRSACTASSFRRARWWQRASRRTWRRSSEARDAQGQCAMRYCASAIMIAAAAASTPFPACACNSLMNAPY
jgi:hypothetical protein